MAKMTMKQARAMRDGTLKGDSAISRAWKELISGGVASEAAQPEGASSDNERGAHTIASWKAQMDAW